MYEKAGGLLRADLFTAGGQQVEPEIGPRPHGAARAHARDRDPPRPLLDAPTASTSTSTAIAGYDETTYRTRLATSTAYEVRIIGGGLTEPGLPLELRRPAGTAPSRSTSPTCRELPVARAAAGGRRLVGARSAAGSQPGSRSRRGRRGLAGDLAGAISGYPIRTLPERPRGHAAVEGAVPRFEAQGARRVAGPEPLLADRAHRLALTRRTVSRRPRPRRPGAIVTWLAVAAPARALARRRPRAARRRRPGRAARPPALPAGYTGSTATYRLDRCRGPARPQPAGRRLRRVRRPGRSPSR